MAEPVPTFPIVSKPQMAILSYLAEVWPVAAPQIEVAVGSGFEDRRTAKRHLTRLLELDLADYDTRLRGWFITDLGKQLVKFACTPNARGMPVECTQGKTGLRIIQS